MITPSVVILTIVELGSEINARTKIHQTTAKLFGALTINVTDVFLKTYLKKLIPP